MPCNLLRVHYTGATDGIEFKVMNQYFTTSQVRVRPHGSMVMVFSSNSWLRQFNKEDGDPFNVTDVVLVMAEEEGFENTAVEGKAIKSFRNGQVLILRDGKTYNTLGVEVK